jgi:membrane protein
MPSPQPSRLARLRRFLAQDAWTAELSSMSGLHRTATRLLRVGQLVIRGFREDDLAVHAASLTFATLVSLVPLLTLGFAMLKGFGGGEEASARLADAMSAMPHQFRDFVQQMVDIVMKANFRTLGWVGVVVLFFTAVQVLGSIETSFNRVWGVTSARTFWRRFTNYVSVTVVVPVLIMTAFAVSASLKNQVVAAHLSESAALSRTLLRLTPLATVWVAFVFLFVFMPNTRVSKRAAGVSAFLSALLWLGWQRVYINMQVALSKYDAVYGTFASVPIFLLWLSVSWMIVLLGAEIAFAVQNHATYHMERTAAQASVEAKVTLALAAMLDVARAFGGGRAVLNVSDYAHQHRVSIRLLNDIVGLMDRGGLLAELADAPGSYALLKGPDHIRVKDVIDLIYRDGTAPATLGLVRLQESMAGLLGDLGRGLDEGAGQLTFAQVLARART